MSADKGDSEVLKRAADAAERELPDGHAFILLAVSPGTDQRLRYISNMDRQTAVTVLKEWLIRASGEEDWMKHL